MTAELESQIEQWRGYVRRRQAIAPADVEEMEGHLRDQLADLVSSGLSEDEAFLVAVKRMGKLDDISREFAREHSQRLWKQLVLTSAGEDDSPASSRNLMVALAFAIAAAIAVRSAMTWLDDTVLARNASLIVLPFVTGYFAWTRQLANRTVVVTLATYGGAALAINLYPWQTATLGTESTTEVLAATHLPIALWFIAGLAYAAGEWRSQARRMDFIRFTGEWVVYLALLALGGGVLVGVTVNTFSALGVGNPEAIAEWVVPTGAAGATVVAAWLVEAKQAVVENIAPVLTRVFTPLTVVMLLAVIGAFVVRFNLVDVDRELLILMDVVLVLVLGLILYAISARDPQAPPSWFDRLQLGLLVVALAADALLLATMITRIADAGVTANKVAALGLNLVLLVNLAWSTRLAAGFVRERTSFGAMEKWQTDYLPVYGLWATFVLAVLPVLFVFR